jgi:hypothetical protein
VQTRPRSLRYVVPALLVVSAITIGVPVISSASGAAKKPTTYVPKPGARCDSGYDRGTKRITVKVKERKRVKGRWRIVAVTKTEAEAVCTLVKKTKTVASTTTTSTTTTTTIAPQVHVTYGASVDPSFSQDVSNPLDVTYSYSADATSTVNGQSVDLGAEGQLPQGVLDFYSGGLLACSMNVGGSTLGGGCEIDYGTTGTYKVTVQYLSGTSSATQSDSESIAINSATTTTLSVSGYPDQGAAQTVVSASFSTAYGALPSATVSFNVGGAIFTPNGNGTSCTINWSGGVVEIAPWSYYAPGVAWQPDGPDETVPDNAILTVTNNPAYYEIGTSPNCSETGFGNVPDTVSLNSDGTTNYGATGAPNNSDYTSSTQSWIS